MHTHSSVEFRKLLLFGACGSLGGALGALVGELTHQNDRGTFLRTLLSTSAWTALIALGIAAALVFAQSYYLSRVRPRTRQILFVGAGAVVSGGIAGFLAQFFFGLASLIFSPESLGTLLLLEAVRILAWTLMGGLLGIGLSFCIPNLRKTRGILGGVLGAAIGGMGFVLVAYTAGDVLGRWLGAGVIGACLGAMVAWIEAAFREAWLELDYSGKEKRTVALGKSPVILGSDRDFCTVFIRGAPPVALKYVVEGGKVWLEDMVRQHTTYVGPGDRRVLGDLAVVVHATSDGSFKAFAHQVASPTKRINSVSPDVDISESSHKQRFAEETPPNPTAHESVSKTTMAVNRATGFFLHVAGRLRPLVEGDHFTARDLDLRNSFQANEICAAVVENPAQPGIFGLKNLTKIRWKAKLLSGETREIEPEKSIRLSKGTRVTIDGTTLLID